MFVTVLLIISSVSQQQVIKYWQDLMEGQKKTVKVATLNYCDIMNNPFEFYCDDFKKELSEISVTFVRILSQYIPNFDDKKFMWEMGKIDQKIRIGRYSPSFSLYVGIENDGFLNREQFEKKWDEAFEKIAKVKEVPFTEDQKKTTRLYDLAVFHTLLAYAFRKDDFNQLIKNPPSQYLDIYRPFYELSFLSEEKKMKKLLDHFQKINADVFFLQQFSWNFMKKMEETNRFHIAYDTAKDKLILAKKAVFKAQTPTQDVLTQEQMASLLWSGEPAAVLICNNFIMINIHLSSREEKNKPQVDKMIRSLEKLKAQLPNYHFIVGGDVNSFFGEETKNKYPEFSKRYTFYPVKEDEPTTIKKRTMSQGQYHKGNKLIKESKDKIITTLQIQRGFISYVNLKPASNDSLIPTDEHPFDHFLITTTLVLP